MWTAFRGRENFLLFVLLSFSFDGRISGPGGGRRSAAGSWPLFFSGVQALRCRAMLFCSRAKLPKSGHDLCSVAATFSFGGFADRNGGAALDVWRQSLRTLIALARCAARHAHCVSVGFAVHAALCQAGVRMKWQSARPLMSRWRLIG